MIHKENTVWFHDHGMNEFCNSSCYEQTPKASHKPWTYFIRIHDKLRQVYPLTYPNRHNRGTVLVKLCDSGELIRVGEGSLVIDR